MTEITYYFSYKSGECAHTVSLDADYESDADSLPDWTKLSFQQCEGCKWEKTSRCPVAIAMQEPVQLLHKLPSFEEVDVRVVTPQREYRKHTSAQEGLSGLFGLVMATSGCPAFSRFKGLAEFHLPFASFEETLFRNVSAHLLRHYFAHAQEISSEEVIADVKHTYEALNKVNIGFSKRLKKGLLLENDSSYNAIVILDSLGAMVAMTVDMGLKQLKERFQ